MRTTLRSRVGAGDAGGLKITVTGHVKSLTSTAEQIFRKKFEFTVELGNRRE
jgi:hypothetical protein